MRLDRAGQLRRRGIDIVAQPPGKRLQNVLLLSGGEKALTALALLIAIFRYQPSPFCILDEVDAPLDEANVGRFTQMLADMSAQTQFIVVTHNRKHDGNGLGALRRHHAGARRLEARLREAGKKRKNRARRRPRATPRSSSVVAELVCCVHLSENYPATSSFFFSR